MSELNLDFDIPLATQATIDFYAQYERSEQSVHLVTELPTEWRQLYVEYNFEGITLDNVICVRDGDVHIQFPQPEEEYAHPLMPIGSEQHLHWLVHRAFQLQKTNESRKFSFAQDTLRLDKLNNNVEEGINQDFSFVYNSSIEHRHEEIEDIKNKLDKSRNLLLLSDAEIQSWHWDSQLEYIEWRVTQTEEARINC